MYTDVENCTETGEDFLHALALLHSTDENSVKALRRMLDSVIAKRHDSSKTLASRIREDPDSALSKIDASYRRSIGNESIKTTNQGSNSSGETEARYDYIDHVRPDESSVVDSYLDRSEIPTISIPEECSGTADGDLCKVCNGAKLGPLILLECQECQDAYHPVCHQPPVLDLDIYDPRLVWHCAKCLELADTDAPVPAKLERKETPRRAIPLPNIGTRRRAGNNGTYRDNFTEHDYFKKGEHLGLASNDYPNEESSSGTRGRRAKTAPCEGQFSQLPGECCSVGQHLRRRVGSRLTISRTSTK